MASTEPQVHPACMSQVARNAAQVQRQAVQGTTLFDDATTLNSDHITIREKSSPDLECLALSDWINSMVDGNQKRSVRKNNICVSSRQAVGTAGHGDPYDSERSIRRRDTFKPKGIVVESPCMGRVGARIALANNDRVD